MPTPDYHSKGYDGQTDAEMLAMCQRGWRSDETPCGTGSEKASAERVSAVLVDVVKRLEINTVVDAGAGDLNWIRDVPWSVAYWGFDLVPRHPSVTQLDITREQLPLAGLILCRHVLNHLSIRQASDALDLFRASRSRYLLMTMCQRQAAYWRQFGLERPQPIAVYKDCQHWWLELSRLC